MLWAPASALCSQRLWNKLLCLASMPGQSQKDQQITGHLWDQPDSAPPSPETGQWQKPRADSPRRTQGHTGIGWWGGGTGRASSRRVAEGVTERVGVCAWDRRRVGADNTWGSGGAGSRQAEMEDQSWGPANQPWAKGVPAVWAQLAASQPPFALWSCLHVSGLARQGG